MTTPRSSPCLSAGGRRGRNMTFAAALVAALFATSVLAQAPAAAPAGAAAPVPDEELEKLVGRIALYPDDLVAVILPASTNPLQLVQADRFLDKRKADPKLPIDDKWDDAVKTLLNYPDIVKMMSADLDWTSALGEAVVADQGDVLEAVQTFRRKAQAAGNLKSDDKQVVKAEKEIIIIEPADPQVIYVPQYNPTTVVTVGVAPIYGYYPTPYPSYYYPYAPGAAFATGVIWGAAIGAAWGGGHYGASYGGSANININHNTNINTGNIGGGANQRPAGGGGSSSWKSGKQPGQVSNSVGKTNQSARAGDSRGGGGGAGASGGARPSTSATGGGVGGGNAGGGARPSQGATGGGGGGGAGASSNRSGSSGGGAFNSAGSSGRQASSASSRGASSRSSSGGGSRGGGGGGGGRRR